ncbi:MAG: DUF1207 domain-containing protein [Planctomycetota bacterium]
MAADLQTRRSAYAARLMLALAIGVAGSNTALALDEDPFLRSSVYGPVDSEPEVSTAYYAGPYGTATATDIGTFVPNANDVSLTGYGDVVVDGYGGPRGGYTWQLLPDGLIFRSFQAGPREPRISTKLFHNSATLENSQTLWDGVVGGRRALFRYGTEDPLQPEGWEVDIEGAALVRLNLIEDRDLDASDFRFGVPVTFGTARLQYKTGYYHLSSHLGDELIERTGVNNRINYVRDAILFGVSYFPTPEWRVYGETAYAFFVAGGAEPWEFQFGLEYNKPGPTSYCGTPFFATNAHLREEIDFGGDWTTQLGWLWRGESGSTLRLGLHYVNGKSTQYQFFADNEEQIGFGVWYDF